MKKIRKTSYLLLISRHSLIISKSALKKKILLLNKIIS